MIKVFCTSLMLTTVHLFGMSSTLATYDENGNIGSAEFALAYDNIFYSSTDSRHFAEVVDITTSGIYGKEIRFNLGVYGRASGVVLGGYEYHFGGWYGWGLLDGEKEGYFSIATKNGALLATLYTPDRIFSVSKPALAPYNKLRIAVAETAGQIQVGDLDAIRSSFSQERGTSPVVDHLYVYSNDFEGAVGDFDGDMIPNTRDDAVARFMHLVSSLNTIYINSGINVDARLVYAYPSDLPGSAILTLPQVHDHGNGFIDEIDEVRNLVKADLGHYLRYSGTASGGGGVADGYTGNSANWFDLGSIGYTASVGGNGHETGHNMGMAHGHEDIFTVSVFPYGYGYCMPIDSRRTLMGLGFATCGSGLPVILQYSNPDAIWSPTNEPMGIDYAADPDNAADGKRTHEEAVVGISGMTGVRDFRTGSPSYPDCDGDEILDIIEIFQGTAQDCNGNNIDDACDIASMVATDCDSNGIPDSCQLTELNPTVTRSVVPGNVTQFTYDLAGTLTVNSDVELVVTSTVKCTNTYDWDVYINDMYVGTLFESTLLNTACNGISTDTITLMGVPENMEDLRIEVTQGSINNGGLPCANSVNIELTYHADAPNDINRNGVFDACEPGCTPYDIAAPFGQLDSSDATQFTAWYSSNDLRADFAPPYGTLNYFDANAYSIGYQAGCP